MRLPLVYGYRINSDLCRLANQEVMMSSTISMQPAVRSHTRTFYTLIVTQMLSLIGSRISGLAVSIWVFNQTGNATPLALVSFFWRRAGRRGRQFAVKKRLD